MPVFRQFRNMNAATKREWHLALLVLIAVPLLIMLTAWQLCSVWFDEAVEDLLTHTRQTNQTELEHMMQFVTGSFIPVGGIPQVLAYDTSFHKAAVSPPGDPAREYASALLNYFAERLGIDVMWILDARGICIAASNYKTPESFVGTDYSDRKYYTDPRQGKLGRQFAIGRKTHLPGLFFSAPITVNGSFAGVVTIKSNIPTVAGQILPAGAFIADAQGVVILSGDAALAFHSIPGTSAEQLSPEEKRRLYSIDALEPIAVTPGGFRHYPDIVFFGANPVPAIISSMAVPSEGLTLFAVGEIPQLPGLQNDSIKLFTTTSLGGLLLGFALAGLLMWHKQYEGKLRQAEDEVASLKSNYELILHSAGDGIIGIGPDEIVTFANPAACAMLGTEPKTLEGRRYRSALCGDDNRAALPTFPLPRGKTDAKEQGFIRGGGSSFTAEYILAPMQKGDAFQGATLVFRDISLRKQYEEHIANHRRDLEQQVAERTQTLRKEIERRTLSEEAMKKAQTQAMHASKLASVGQLAAGIAHEINSPVQYVGDNLRFIGDSLSQMLDILHLAETLFAQTDATLASRFTKAMESSELDFLRTETTAAVRESLEGIAQIGRIVLSMKEFSHPGSRAKAMTDINRALENTLIVSRNVWKHVAEIDRQFDPSLPPVLCYSGEINQAFLNLIVNAAQAIESSGKKIPGRITIATSHDQNQVTIRISDSGNGVPDSIREKIFDPFFTTKDVGKGTGQGLAICYDVVVSKHGGSLELSGQEGEGATFIIHLPIDQSDEPPAVDETVPITD